jgi:alpha-tubulin suppressor-like RCC1 family protein
MAGYQHSLAVKTDGTLWAWGNNSQGQLGLGNINPVTTFTKVTIGKVKDIVTKQGNSFAILEDGSLYVYGNNSSGGIRMIKENKPSSTSQHH